MFKTNVDFRAAANEEQLLPDEADGPRRRTATLGFSGSGEGLLPDESAGETREGMEDGGGEVVGENESREDAAAAAENERVKNEKIRMRAMIARRALLEEQQMRAVMDSQVIF